MWFAHKFTLKALKELHSAGQYELFFTIFLHARIRTHASV